MPKYAIVQEAETSKYAISLYYKLGVGNSAFAANFSGAANPGYNPQELANVYEVKLAHGVDGFFRPVSCGGSCAPANLWWKIDGNLYQVQVNLVFLFNKVGQQKKTITEIADSAILAGPR
jgi:hypothetical protein